MTACFLETSCVLNEKTILIVEGMMRTIVASASFVLLSCSVETDRLHEHEHDNYLPIVGGVIEGDLGVTGNVGVGTASPAASLHVQRMGGGYELLLQDVGAADIGLVSGQPGAERWTMNAQDHGFGIKNEDDNAYYLSIDNSGHVGFGWRGTRRSRMSAQPLTRAFL